MDRIHRYGLPERIDWSEFLRAQTNQSTIQGRWKLDPTRSQSIDLALCAFRVPMWIRACTKFVRNMDLRVDDSFFRCSVGGLGLWVSETHALNGPESMVPRRDRRSGLSRVSCTGTPWFVTVASTWDSPHAGQCTETYELESRDTLLARKEWVVTDMGTRIGATQIFDRVE